jgi:mono/diheme cytochrome c family protein
MLPRIAHRRAPAVFGALAWAAASRGEGGQLGKPLSSGLTIEDIMATARSGVAGTSMPPFGNAYSVEQLLDVANYIERSILTQR